MGDDRPAGCPFCGFKTRGGGYAIQLHIEEHHTEDSPFVVNDASAAQAHKLKQPDRQPGLDECWTKCTRPRCGEYVHLSDIDEHLQFHEAASLTEPDHMNGSETTILPQGSQRKPDSDTITTSPVKHRRPQVPNNGRRSPQKGLTVRDYFQGSSHHGSSSTSAPRPKAIPIPREPGRLGKRELGPHAFEKSMPAAVRYYLQHGDAPRQINRIALNGKLIRETVVDNETAGLIPLIADLCALDPATQVTYLCDPSVRHVARLQCEGNFCGYWNIQMLLTFLHHHRRQSSANPASATTSLLPTVLQIQDTIEQAWSAGICAHGRVETGGLRGTRKWIGTQEALAYFTQSGFDVSALSFTEEASANSTDFEDWAEDGDDNYRPPAAFALLDYVEAYFQLGLSNATARSTTTSTVRPAGTSHITTLSPIYFQRFGHSMTIVGLERLHSGARNLLVFDPSFGTSTTVRRLLDAGAVSGVKRLRDGVSEMLEAYRRPDAGLFKWDEFEIVVVGKGRR